MKIPMLFSNPYPSASTLVASAILLGCGGWTLQAQVQPQPTAAAQAQPIPLSSLPDPTKPEVQPPLNVDRDPISSPDREVPPPPPAVNAGKQGAPQFQKGQNGVYTLHAEVDEVLLNCTVIDDKGRTVSGLTKDDFRVWEDGVPQPINSVVHQDLPVSMGILVDNSGSMREKRGAVNVAALNLVRESNPQDEAFVVNFSDRAYLDQGFTSNLVSLDRGLSRVDTKGTTALYDAVAASADELSKHARMRKEVLLIITDGADNASRLTLQEVIRRVQDLGGPVVYCVGLLFDTDSAESDRARNALERLAEETGGIAYFPRSLDEVNDIAGQVAHDIRNQYTVDYHSTKPTKLGGYRSVHVEAYSRRGKLSVRTRKGYFAKPSQAQGGVQQAERQ
ncbi:MAG TPA: VWA domain-containing protein [Terracidiphilus sp.]|nr:VWA domain-containing protein [Terracidiphilus sp.]